MKERWECTACQRLLGIERRGRLYLRYKDVQYVVDGEGYVVTAACRRCSILNERRSPKNRS